MPDEINKAGDECEEALIKAGVEIFDREMSRGRMLVKPVMVAEDAVGGGTTTSARFHEFNLYSFKEVLDRNILFTSPDARKGGGVKRTAAPDEVAKRLLSRPDAGEAGFASVEGIIATPTFRPDGTLLDRPGYDPATKLYLALDPSFRLPPIPLEPTKEDAQQALAFLDALLEAFPFEGEIDRAGALSMILTATLRGSMDVAPFHVTRSHQSGSGKGHLTNTATVVATGRRCPAMNAGQNAEELEKRLSAILLEGASVFSIDNCNRELGGEFLNSVITESVVQTRILGKSLMPKCKVKAMAFANGNNLRLTGDMARRSVLVTLDAKVEQPETREFKFDPIMKVMADRPAYVAAVLTVNRAWRLARARGERVNCKPLAGFEQWSQGVREALIWLGRGDCVASQSKIREDDPERINAAGLLVNWPHEHPKAKDGLTTSEIIDIVHTNFGAKPGDPQPPNRCELRDLFVAIASSNGKDISVLRLSKWFTEIEGRVVAGQRLMSKRKIGHSNRYFIERVQ